MKAIRIVESQEKAPYNTNVENKSCIFNFNLVKCGGTVRIMIMSLGTKEILLAGGLTDHMIDCRFFN